MGKSGAKIDGKMCTGTVETARRDFDFRTISPCLCLSPKLTQIGRACLPKDTGRLSKGTGTCLCFCVFLSLFLDKSGTKKA